jgi:hypothetical protein
LREKTLRNALDTLDNMNLDDHAAFPGRTSTTERVAEHLAELLAKTRADARRILIRMLSLHDKWPHRPMFVV